MAVIAFKFKLSFMPLCCNVQPKELSVLLVQIRSDLLGLVLLGPHGPPHSTVNTGSVSHRSMIKSNVAKLSVPELIPNRGQSP